MKTKILHTTNLFIAVFLLALFTHTDVMGDEKLELGIDDIIAAALQHNLGLKAGQLSPQISGQAVIVEGSVFDPVFSLQTSGTGSSVENDSSTDSTGYGVGLSASKKFGPGTNITLSLDYLNSSTEAAGAEGEGSSTSATLTITQPLLKNAGQDVNQRGVTVAENDLETSRLNLKQTVIDTVSEAQQLYWQYYHAVSYLEVQQKSLALAQKSMQEMEEKIKIGSSPKLNLLSSRAEVASREQSVIVAENDVDNRRDELLNYIYGTLSGNMKVICKDPPSFKEPDVNEQTLTEYALEYRTDYLILRFKLDSAEANVRYYDNQRLPQLDLSVTLAANDGQADDRAIAQFQSDDYYDNSYGMVALSLKYPFGLRKDRANYTSALLTKRQAVIEKEQAKSRIQLEVRTALRDVQSARKRYQAAQLASQYGEEALAVEQEKYGNGLSTSYQVLQYQRDLADAETTEVEAMVQYQTAVIQLHRTTGATLEQLNITLNGETL